MSDDTNVGEYPTELQEAQEIAKTARAAADQLKSALTDQSSDEEKKAAEEAKSTAIAAEKALADAQAKADADAAAKADADAKAKADAEAAANGEGSDQGSTAKTPDANESRTGIVEKGNAGDECICPDGRKGTVHKFDNGLICIPNADQS